MKTKTLISLNNKVVCNSLKISGVEKMCRLLVVGDEDRNCMIYSIPPILPNEDF
jgi:hypothetical protein